MGRKVSLFWPLALLLILLSAVVGAGLNYQRALDQQAGELLRKANSYKSHLTRSPSDFNFNAAELEYDGYILRYVRQSPQGLQVLWENNARIPAMALQNAVRGRDTQERITWQHHKYQIVAISLSSGYGLFMAVSYQPLLQDAINLGLWLLGLNLVLVLVLYLVGRRWLVERRDRKVSELGLDHMTGIAFFVGRNFYFTDGNSAFWSLFNMQDCSKLEDIVTEEDWSKAQGYLQQSKEDNVAIDFECSLLDQYQEVGRWALHVKPWYREGYTGWLVTGDDISKRHHMELELRNEQQRVTAYFDSMQTLLVICDKYGNIERINQQTQAMLDLPQSQLIGYPIRSLLPNSEAARLLGMWRELLTSDIETLSLECPMISASGKESIISWRITKVEDPGTGRVEVVLAGLDISESVANRTALEVANRRIRETLSQAEAANQSKSIFLASMSHEIRTPMNGILGAAELLLESPLQDEQRNYLEIIHSSSNALLDIINDILDLSKIESGNLEIERIDFDLNKLLRDVYQLFSEPSRRRGLGLVYLYDSALPARWLGDPKRIRQIITNLVSNALKFTEQGRIEIRVSGETFNDHSHRLNIRVNDTGIGVSQEKIEQIFSAFRQADTSTSRKYGGTGLGLTISRHLAQAMGGDIQVSSELGQGSCFTLQLTLQADDQSTTEPAVKDRDAAPAEVPKDETKLSGLVLLAEDNQVNQRIAEKMLQRLGLSCHIVENGEQAVAEVLQKDYDLVLMDVNMPVLDGIAATERIRDLSYPKNQVSIIALTANAMMEDRNRCLAAGMNGFVSKPIKLDALREAIAGMLEKS